MVFQTTDYFSKLWLDANFKKRASALAEISNAEIQLVLTRINPDSPPGSGVQLDTATFDRATLELTASSLNYSGINEATWLAAFSNDANEATRSLVNVNQLAWPQADSAWETIWQVVLLDITPEVPASVEPNIWMFDTLVGGRNITTAGQQLLYQGGALQLSLSP